MGKKHLNTGYKNSREQLAIFDEFVEKAYEGMVVVDAEGRITKFKYEKLLGIKEEDAIGKHITEVIENTRLHKVVKTGKPEIGDLQIINGHEMVTTRIPIERDGKIVGAVGTVLFKDVSQVKYMAEHIDNMHQQMKKYKHASKHLNQAKYTFDSILTQNPRMLYLIDTARRAAETNSTVCIQGGSGTGKELFAHAIHNESNRNYGPFVKINCAAIPDTLMESELFGYDPGAFTGAATTGKIGKFELASGGTIFLDEIGTMPLEMQAKLLRVLEEREFEHIGGNDKIEIDVRVIAATNEDLRSLVKAGRFREDLYYRLDVVSLKIPPLSVRHDDIPILAQSMLQSFLVTYPHGPTSFSDGAMKLLRKYDWPGNVRELRNVVERSVNMARSKVIYSKDMPQYIRSLRDTAERPEIHENISKDRFTDAFDTTFDNAFDSTSDNSFNKAVLDRFDESFDDGFSHDHDEDFIQTDSIEHDLSKVTNRELNLQHQIELLEPRVIEEALRRCDGNRTEAAKMLGLHRTSLYKKLGKYGIYL